jgi:hypothetical protein
MATSVYVDDVLSLAAGLRDSELVPAVLAATRAGGDADAVTVDVHISADALRPAITVQQALQLCVDAAALFVDAAVENRELDADYAVSFLAEPPIELTVVGLGTGSFRARFSINPMRKTGRDRLIAIGGLVATGLMLTGVLAPVALTAAGGLVFLNGVLTPDTKLPTQVPLQTIDPAEAQNKGIEVKIASDGNARTYEIRISGTPDATASFRSSLLELDSLLAHLYPDEESEGPERAHMVIRVAGPLDLELVRTEAERLGIEFLWIREIDQLR